MKIKNGIFLLGLLLAFASCEEKTEARSTETIDEEIAEVRENYAPDARVALFDIEANRAGDAYVLKGESNLPDAVASLKKKLEEENISYTDSIQMLPDEKGLESKTWGVVPISVANLRDEPKHSAQLVTQATLGMPLKVLKKTDSWYYVQTPDGYLAWVDYGGIVSMSKSEFDTWKASEKVIFTETFGASYQKADKASAVAGDLVAGNILELTTAEGDFYEVKYPNGKKAYIERSNAMPYSEWLSGLDQDRESLVSTSKELMGLPYLWGGTSSKGVDCSGFTKTVYFLNGFVLPRDASQQVHAGKLVDTTKNFENLIPGDLLFFGRKATDSTSERVVHVGMWIGDNKFIHSMGEVHISNFDTTATDFDDYNYGRYLRTKRVLNEEKEKMINLKDSSLFTQ
ncbi:glycoside hydrolase [Gramella sp. BOM4]|nr:glycoside hydrolase [Christiangramia bathymodioli]